MQFFTKLILLAVTACLLIGLTGRWIPLADVINVLQSQLLIAGICALMVALAQRSMRRPSIVLAWSIANLIAVGILSFLDRVPAPPASSGLTAARPLKIVSLNLWLENRTPTTTAEWILRQNADALILLEAAGNSEDVPLLLKHAYPFQTGCLRRPGCSTMVLLREKPLGVFPLARGDANNRQSLSAAAVQIGDASAPITIMAVHLSHPFPFGPQLRELKQLESAIGAFGSGRLILAGDFNTPLTTYAMKTLLARKALHPVGPQAATWPADSFVWPLVQIDHILAGGECRGTAQERGPFVGSDHSPVIAVVRCR